MTAHIESKLESIAPLVIMPGDPLRAKMIAEEYLTNYVQVNSIRGMLAYTGFYKDVRVTVFASGMGIPSMGIYAYELFKFYNVQKIIRIGSCGSLNRNVKVKDLVLATDATTTSSFARVLGGDSRTVFMPSLQLNKNIEKSANSFNVNLHQGHIITSEVFDVYCDTDTFLKNYETKEYLVSEMEASALFYLAEAFQREASCILTVVDSKFEQIEISPLERQNSLNQMIEIALEALLLSNTE